MKKILVSFIAMMAVASSAWAAETMNMHDQVNNGKRRLSTVWQILKFLRG